MFFKQKRSIKEAADDALQYHFQQSSRALDSILRAARRTSQSDIATITAGLPKLQDLWVPVISTFGQKFASPNAQRLHSEIVNHAKSEIMWPKIAEHYDGVNFEWQRAQQLVEQAPSSGAAGHLVKLMVNYAYPSFDFLNQEFNGGANFVSALNYVEFIANKYKLN